LKSCHFLMFCGFSPWCFGKGEKTEEEIRTLEIWKGIHDCAVSVTRWPAWAKSRIYLWDVRPWPPQGSLTVCGYKVSLSLWMTVPGRCLFTHELLTMMGLCALSWNSSLPPSNSLQKSPFHKPPLTLPLNPGGAPGSYGTSCFPGRHFSGRVKSVGFLLATEASTQRVHVSCLREDHSECGRVRHEKKQGEGECGLDYTLAVKVVWSHIGGSCYRGSVRTLCWNLVRSP
jgi:hypothetical protein